MNKRIIRIFLLFIILTSLYLYSPKTPQIQNTDPLQSNNEIADYLPDLSQGFRRNVGNQFSYILSTRDKFVGFGKSQVWFSVLETNGNDQIKSVHSLTFQNSNAVDPVPNQPSSTKFSSFIGKASTNWIVNEPLYHQLIYYNLYDSIDLIFTIGSEGLKYDFIVHPNANPSNIELQWKGDLKMDLSDTRVNLVSSANPDRTLLKDFQLYVTQGNEAVNAKFVKTGELAYGFKISNYNSHKDLTIDPLIEFFTHIGGSGTDEGFAITKDSNQNIIIAGATPDSATDFPTTPGAYQETHNGSMDGFITKLSPNGSQVIFSTFLGGSGNDVLHDVKIDSAGNIIVCGYGASDYPTLNAYNQTNSGMSDAVLSKLSSDGSSLIFSTFIGGGLNDEATQMYVMNDNSIFITGYTYRYSTTSQIYFPETAGTYNSIHVNGYQHNFISHFAANGSTLLTSSLFGEGHPNGIDIDKISGDIVIAGYSLGLAPTSFGAFNETYSGNEDVSILRIPQDLSAVYYGTYIGGTDSDYANAVKFDSTGSIVIAGSTINDTYLLNPVVFPTTSNAYNTTPSGAEDVFVSRFSGNLSILLASTLIGGTSGDVAYDLQIDNDDTIIVVGLTDNYAPLIPYPTTSGAFNKSTFGYIDLILSKLDTNCSKLLYSTYISINFDFYANAAYVDQRGRVYLTGKGYLDAFAMSIEINLRPDAPVTTYQHFYTNGPEVQISWPEPDPGDAPITSYIVYRGIDPYSLLPLATTTLTTYTEVINQTYYYQVAAVSEFGSGAKSTRMQIDPIYPPSEPLSLQITLSGSNPLLSWNPPSSSGGDSIKEYLVYRGLNSHQYTTIFNTTNSAFLDISVLSETTYYYSVVATNSAGEGLASLEVNITTPVFNGTTVTTNILTTNHTDTSIVVSTRNVTISSTIYNITTTITNTERTGLSPTQRVILDIVSSSVAVYGIGIFLSLIILWGFYRRRKQFDFGFIDD